MSFSCSVHSKSGPQCVLHSLAFSFVGLTRSAVSVSPSVPSLPTTERNWRGSSRMNASPASTISSSIRSQDFSVTVQLPWNLRFQEICRTCQYCSLAQIHTCGSCSSRWRFVVCAMRRRFKCAARYPWLTNANVKDRDFCAPCGSRSKNSSVVASTNTPGRHHKLVRSHFQSALGTSKVLRLE